MKAAVGPRPPRIHVANGVDRQGGAESNPAFAPRGTTPIGFCR